MPFENVNDPSFLYHSSQHKEALARMQYAVQQKKLGVLLVGEYGTGKTFLSRILKRSVSEDKFVFIFITNPRFNSLDFIKEINYQLGGKIDELSKPTKMDYLRSIRNSFQEHKEKELFVVLVVDEAQSIKEDDLLEEIRLLLNIQSEESTYFTLVLMGQPQLEIEIEKIPQFKQRLSIRYTLDFLSSQETKEYIEHRLKVAGTQRKIFTDDAYQEIFSISRGMPRAINNICDLSLLNAFIQKQGMINKEIVLHVAQDLGESSQDKSILKNHD